MGVFSPVILHTLVNHSTASRARFSQAELSRKTRFQAALHKKGRALLLLLVVYMNDIDKVLSQNNLLGAFRENAALLLWDTLIGERLGRYTQAAFVRDRVLVVHVSSSTVAHELVLLKPQLLSKLNQQLDTHPLQDVRFVQRAIPREEKPIERIQAPQSHRAAHEMFKHLPDERLARTFEHLVASQKDREVSLLAAGGRQCPRCGAVYLGDAEICPGCRYDPIDARQESR